MVRGQNINMNTEVWKNLITTLMDDWMVQKILVEEELKMWWKQQEN